MRLTYERQIHFVIPSGRIEEINPTSEHPFVRSGDGSYNQMSIFWFLIFQNEMRPATQIVSCH